MGHSVIEDVEDRIKNRVIRRKIIKTDDSQYPSGYRYAFHYGYTDGRGTILRYLENLRFSTTHRNGHRFETTTRTRLSVDTSATQQTASPKSSFQG